MPLQVHPYSLVLTVAAIIAATDAVVAWHRRSAPGAIPLAILNAGAAVWAGTYAVMWASTTLPAEVFWLNMTYFGVVVIPTSYLAFVLQFSGQGAWLTRRRLALLCIEPVFIFTAVWTNPYHHLYHTLFELAHDGPLVYLHWERGPFFWANVVYSYPLLLITFVILIRTFRHASGPYRAQTGIILIASFIPWAANIYTESGLSHFHDLDLTPVAFSAMGVVIAFAMFRYRLFDLVPIARSLLIEKMSDGVVVLDVQARVVDMNIAARTLTNFKGSFVGKYGRDIFAAWPDIVAMYRNVQNTRTEVKLNEQPERYFELQINPLYDEKERFVGRLIVLRDISERKRAEVARRNAEESYRALFDHAQDAIFVEDDRQKIVDANPAASRLVGYSRRELLHMDSQNLQSPEDLKNGMLVQPRFEARLIHRNGNKIPVEVTQAPFKQGNQRLYIEIVRDMSERKQAEQELQHAHEDLQKQYAEIQKLEAKLREQAIRDPLTGLYNRRYIQEALRDELTKAEQGTYPLSVLLLDLDHFKAINDTFGHEAGDLILKALARHLTANTRKNDIVCRYGGEEFVVVMPAISLEKAHQRAENWLASFQQMRVQYKDRLLSCTFSAGVAGFPEIGRTIKRLFDAADRAMYAAKQSGRNQVVVFSIDKLA